MYFTDDISMFLNGKYRSEIVPEGAYHTHTKHMEKMLSLFQKWG